MKGRRREKHDRGHNQTDNRLAAGIAAAPAPNNLLRLNNLAQHMNSCRMMGSRRLMGSAKHPCCKCSKEGYPAKWRMQTLWHRCE